MPESRVITVEVAGQRYPIRSKLDTAYVAELATYVDDKIRTAADAAPASDGVGLAVLAALNIADELFRAREQSSTTDGTLNDRASRLEQMLDELLVQVKTKKPLNIS